MRAGLPTRVGWLLALAGLGALVGLAVRALGGGDAGFLAMPAAVIAGWLVFADPRECEPRHGRGRRRATRARMPSTSVSPACR